jgi:simple sugar transport system ATP-binding protein
MSSPPNPTAPGATPSPRLQLVGITKRYPAVVANSGVSLTVQPGEIHAVLGENGAGKSTLMKIIYGSVKPDEGSVYFNGQAVQVRNPQEARSLGIGMVFQHFSLFDTLTVAENVWLGLDKSLSLSEVTQRITTKAAEYGLDIDPLRPVHTLSVGEMQRVEIIRALLTNPKLLILDEPTSVLTPQAVEKLFVVLRQLASEGCSILYISHKLHEIRELCTACTVLRGGKVTGVCNPAEESNASLSRLMIGAEPPALTHRAVQAGATVLRVHGLSLPRADQFGVDLIDIEFEVRSGEVVGIAGVSGRRSCSMPCPAKTSGRRPAASRWLAEMQAAWPPARAARWACTLCPKSVWAVAPCPRWVSRTTSCSRAPTQSAAVAGSRCARCKSTPRTSSRAST